MVENTSTFLEVVSGMEEVKIVEKYRVFGRISGFPKDKTLEPTQVFKIQEKTRDMPVICVICGNDKVW